MQRGMAVSPTGGNGRDAAMRRYGVHPSMGTASVDRQKSLPWSQQASVGSWGSRRSDCTAAHVPRRKASCNWSLSCGSRAPMHGKMLTSAMKRAVSPCGCRMIFRTPPSPWPLASLATVSGTRSRPHVAARQARPGAGAGPGVHEDGVTRAGSWAPPSPATTVTWGHSRRFVLAWAARAGSSSTAVTEPAGPTTSATMAV